MTSREMSGKFKSDKKEKKQYLPEYKVELI